MGLGARKALSDHTKEEGSRDPQTGSGDTKGVTPHLKAPAKNSLDTKKGNDKEKKYAFLLKYKKIT